MRMPRIWSLTHLTSRQTWPGVARCPSIPTLCVSRPTACVSRRMKMHSTLAWVSTTTSAMPIKGEATSTGSMGRMMLGFSTSSSPPRDGSCG